MNEEIMNVNETEVEENDYSLPAVQEEDNWDDDYVDGVCFDEETEPSGSTAKGVAIGLGITAAVAGLGIGAKKLIDKLKARKTAKEESEELTLTDKEELEIRKARRERDEAEIKRLEEKIKAKQEENEDEE